MPLLLLFITVPLIEIALFIQLGSVLDLGWILLIVVLTAILGTWLVRRQGRGVLRQIQGSIDTLRDPTEPLAHGAMILFSGALLLTPGFFTDAVGFLLLVPAVRMLAFRWLRTRISLHASRGSAGGQRHGGPGPRGPDPRRDPRFGPRGGPEIIDGEFSEVSPETDPVEEDARPRQGARPSGWTRE